MTLKALVRSPWLLLMTLQPTLVLCGITPSDKSFGQLGAEEAIDETKTCGSVDNARLLQKGSFANSAVSYLDMNYDDLEEEEIDEEDWFVFVAPEDDLQLNMPPDMAAEYWNYPDQPNFLVPHHLEPGEVENIRWRDDGQIVDDPEIFVVGLPPELLPEFRTYIQTIGMLEVVQELLYSNHTQPQPDLTKLFTLKDGHKWSAKRADHWETDMVWFDPADEACYERLRQILRKGHFDTVVQAIAKRLGKPKLTVHGMGAIFVSRFQFDTQDYFQIHRDVPDSRGAFYNILVPIYLPSSGDASLYIGGEDHLCSPIYLKENAAIVVGSDSWHGTGECDYTASQEYRLSMSIWVSEITPQTLEVIASDGLSPWPLDGDDAWYMAQAERNLTVDVGRSSFEVRDMRRNCQLLEHKCDTDWEGVRAKCAKTCRVYMGPSEYAQYMDTWQSL